MAPLSDEAWRDLIPQIEGIARKVARHKNASPTVRDALFSEAVGHIFDKRTSFDDTVARFSTWCWTVLANLCVSMIAKEAVARRRRDRHRNDEEYRQQQMLRQGRSASSSEDGADEEEQREPRPDLFSLLEDRLKPQDRLLVATYSGVLDACGRDVVERWCREAECEQAHELYRIAGLPTAQRKQAIAIALHRKLDWVRTRIYRALEALK